MCAQGPVFFPDLARGIWKTWNGGVLQGFD